MFERILVPFDGSDNSKKALQVAIDLASKYDSRLYIIEVVNETIFYSVGILPPLKELESMERKAKEDVKFAVTEAERVGVREQWGKHWKATPLRQFWTTSTRIVSL